MEWAKKILLRLLAMPSRVDYCCTNDNDKELEMTAHANCTHPATKAARAACRRNAARIADARNTPIDIDGMTVKYHSSPIVKEVEVGHLLITPKGVAEVKKIDYANPIMRTGWKFTMSDGEEMIFSLHNETVIRMIEV